MSDYMLLVDYKRGKYDPDDVHRILTELPGIANLERGEGGRPGATPIEADFTFGAETTQLRLLGDYSSLSIEAFNDAGLTLAVEFSAKYTDEHGRELALFNMGYDFHQKLDRGTNLESLKDSIEHTPFAGAKSNE